MVMKGLMGQSFLTLRMLQILLTLISPVHGAGQGLKLSNCLR